ncbi:MAG: hypothetical protein ACI9J3_003302 [Parvicellaceae bacterium]|jgi:hypothetical protein
MTDHTLHKISAIASYMSFRQIKGGDQFTHNDIRHANTYTSRQLPYNESWELLKPVIAKFEQDYFKLDHSMLLQSIKESADNVIIGITTSDKSKVFNSLYRFITLYDNQVLTEKNTKQRIIDERVTKENRGNWAKEPERVKRERNKRRRIIRESQEAEIDTTDKEIWASVSKKFSLTCIECKHNETKYQPDLKSAAIRFLNGGWRKSKSTGEITCPTCSEKYYDH